MKKKSKKTSKTVSNKNPKISQKKRSQTKQLLDKYIPQSEQAEYELEP
jgi:hypothetical protein